jgi:hypothetical protein
MLANFHKSDWLKVVFYSTFPYKYAVFALCAYIYTQESSSKRVVGKEGKTNSCEALRFMFPIKWSMSSSSLSQQFSEETQMDYDLFLYKSFTIPNQTMQLQ